jgi:protein-S-isoprenylcysteine O-methyltransferase Ste14
VWLGSGMLLASVILVVFAARALARARTAFDVRKSTTSMVTGGVFRLTRNPVYLSMTFLYLGVSLLLNSVPMAVVVVPLGSILCIIAIKPEERYLESKFGASYRSYRQAVPRWL